MRTFSTPGELVDAAGTELGTSPYQTVLQHDVDVFAALTGDLQWIHIDPERARSGPFGGPVAHGMYTLSLILPLLADVFTVDGPVVVVHKGFDRVRFAAPVTVGARVRVSAELRSADVRARGFTEAVLAVAVEVEGERWPACTADLRLLYQEEAEEEWVPIAS
ncbi:MaoC family dehydratase [Actinophytocola algeriensis]|uniref:Acyl dehydratase n=1 Tax=Actinophytocola algeriensis TaxID=1768010 RepID=A0A7W7VJL0_9PSEU|nr:MaoC family dehydratase [Actinophytocola algeriensis]MBB4912598.1 acyl dehydratase [Actinophytocola algeriensis]MBE1478972.1 acyl dehydratase [Actinophytocola algeriensis]